MEGLDLVKPLKTMMGAQTQQIFKMLSGFIKRLAISLQKVGDLIFSGWPFAWREELGEECSCQLIPCGYASRR